jgi:hypothetical protein
VSDTDLCQGKAVPIVYRFIHNGPTHAETLVPDGSCARAFRRRSDRVLLSSDWHGFGTPPALD